ncbi:tRNA modification GTPase TrmE [Spiroplasma culicicola AES-1]|uniref:tRNA modification GTPase MnmE n=1 Tax=Spiroplasma culicicola AES-1 TaxID=1276246 RepID=W6A8B7_9MOLU|nr:tRNA uridine-5-carboxymethylaminomethyl(34) synthesis GTPase MnmE [Spiroplasma culicicola]AHI53408.1 tRNA modification GTPase TrmE [Spiroplasma culicicola AES-1]
MNKLFLEDTIVAPATKLAKQAISIIRISGSDAFKITNKILKDDLIYKNTQQLRKIYDNNFLIDEALIITFIDKKSFTGENVVEINCHGGVLVTKKIISLLINNGARMAEPGEFSQRAFLNSKINLLQAESINNLIESKNELALKINAIGVTGQNNKELLNIKENLVDIISRIQTSIDYPDYDDIEGSDSQSISKVLQLTNNNLKKIINISKRAQNINEGIQTLILGAPNVGKSSLLNSLINEDKAIVTDIEGTTRDIVEGQLNFDNFTLNLIDTAGIRKTQDAVEQIGIEKSLKLISQAELILYVIDNQIDDEIMSKIKDKNFIIVRNKIDILDQKQLHNLKNNSKDMIFISAKENNVEPLIKKIEAMWNNEEVLESSLPIITNMNSIINLEKIFELIQTSIKNLNQGFTIDMINLDLYNALDILNNILGIIDADEEIINNIFKKYCLGK